MRAPTFSIGRSGPGGRAVSRLNARVILVLATAAVILLFYVPLGHTDFANRWGDGTFGIHLPPAGGTTVSSVDPGSPAWKAGLRPGDTVVESWEALSELSFPRAGDRAAMTFLDPSDRRHAVTMRAVSVANFGAIQRILGILAIVPATIFLAIAFALVYLRPGIMTWSFYLFAIGYYSTGPVAMYYWRVAPHPVYFAIAFIIGTLFGSFSVMPLLPFVLRFPGGDLRGWRKKADGYVWAFLACSFGAYVYEWLYLRMRGVPWQWAPILDTWLPLLTFAIAAAIVLKNYRVAGPEIRQRTGFLIGGVMVSFVAYAVYFVPGVPSAAAQIIGYLVVLMPISVAYAALRHRVIDVNFVLNRAIAYTLLSIAVLIAVSLLDWASGQIVSRIHFATAIEIAVTIGVGFLLSRVNTIFESWVDVLLFRRRHEAERYLRRAAAALPYSTSEEAIADGLVHEPVDALELTAAALYRQSQNGRRFEGVGTSSETAVAPMGFEGDHPLVRFLKADEDVVWLSDVRAHLDAENSALYVIAIPISVRHEIVSFVLYGAHKNGAQIDPDEVGLLKDLAREAARAYDHVEAVRTRELLANLKAEPARTP